MLSVAVHRHHARRARQVLPHPREGGAERGALPAVHLMHEHGVHVAADGVERLAPLRGTVVHHHHVREIFAKPAYERREAFRVRITDGNHERDVLPRRHSLLLFHVAEL